jgi:hypothetical protein
MLLANFGTFWKDFLYKVIVFGIVVLLTLPVFNVFTKINGFDVLASQAENLFLTFPFSNIEVFITSSFELIQLLFQFIANLFTNYFWHGFNLAVMYLIVLPFFLGLSELGITEVLYGNMATNTKYNYSASFIKTLKRAIKLSFLKTIANLIITTFLLVAIYGVLLLAANNIVSIIFIPMLIILVICLIEGFKITLFSGWAPSIVVFNTGVFDGFKKGFKAVCRRFFKTYSTAAMLVLITILFVNFLGISSFMLLLPMVNLLTIAFGMIMFFGSQGMRYYVDPDTILSPKKLEETDKFEDAKNII